MTTSSVDTPAGPGWLRPGRLVVSSARGPALFGLALAGLVLVGSVFAGAIFAEVRWLSYAKNASLLRAAAVLAGLALVAALGLPRALFAVRRLANTTRRWSHRWCGVTIAEPYDPRVAGDSKPASWTWTLRVLGQVATWRDLAWMLVAPLASPFLLLPLGVAGWLVWYAVAPAPGQQHTTAGVLALLAVTLCAIASSPWLLRGYGHLARLLLGPTSQTGAHTAGPPPDYDQVGEPRRQRDRAASHRA